MSELILEFAITNANLRNLFLFDYFCNLNRRKYGTMKTDKIKIGITQGDMNGTGCEIIIKALSDNRITEEYTPVIFGSPKVMAFYRKALNVQNFNINSINSAKEADSRKINLVNCIDDNVRVEPGKPVDESVNDALLCLESAIDALNQGDIDVLVTMPFSNIKGGNNNFPGHTEYLRLAWGAEDSMVIMSSDILKVAVLTGNLPLSEVPANITQEKILSKIQLLDNTMLQDFGIRRARIAVLSLNPYTNADTLTGKEEEMALIPAIEKARQEGLLAFGPYSADDFFGSDKFKHFDIILAMYNDQGLIPFKTLVYDSGANYTAGLPFVRTSPVHDVGYNIAGKGEASADSFRTAIYTAVDIYRNRAGYKSLIENKMPETKERLETARIV